MSTKHGQLEALIEPIVASFGCVFWGFEYQGNMQKALLRVYIDKPDEGVHIDDCARVSRQISSVLDVEDLMKSEYTLEVSSPGMDRPLFTPDQYHMYIGEHIKLRLRIAFDGRRKFKGLLKAIENDEVVLHIDEEEYLLPLELIEKANVVPRF